MRGRRLAALLFATPLALSAVACRSAPKPFVPEEWVGEGVVPYRLVSKDDFRASSSSSPWGNVAHGAEICTVILPAEDYDESGVFHAVMRPDCSFWNKVIGPLGRVTRLVGLAAGVPTVTPVKQPDWYILQHEQVHFAINESAARTLTRKLSALPRARRTVKLTRRVYQLTVDRTAERQRRFDQETSGRYDTFLLEKWVRLLERELEESCADGQECRVRTTSD
jgi:hypothetical protein